MAISDNRLITYFKESYRELRKVVWPSRKDTVKHTLMVIGISLGVAIFLGLADYLLNIVLTRLIS